MMDMKFIKFVINEYIEKSKVYFLNGVGTSHNECQEIWGNKSLSGKKKKKTKTKVGGRV